jgi:hypothetical protein
MFPIPRLQLTGQVRGRHDLHDHLADLGRTEVVVRIGGVLDARVLGVLRELVRPAGDIGKLGELAVVDLGRRDAAQHMLGHDHDLGAHHLLDVVGIHRRLRGEDHRAVVGGPETRDDCLSLGELAGGIDPGERGDVAAERGQRIMVGDQVDGEDDVLGGDRLPVAPFGAGVQLDREVLAVLALDRFGELRDELQRFGLIEQGVHREPDGPLAGDVGLIDRVETGRRVDRPDVERVGGRGSACTT